MGEVKVYFSWVNVECGECLAGLDVVGVWSGWRSGGAVCMWVAHYKDPHDIVQCASGLGL